MCLSNYFSGLFRMYLVFVNLSHLLALTRKSDLLTNMTSTDTFNYVFIPKISSGIST